MTGGEGSEVAPERSDPVIVSLQGRIVGDAAERGVDHFARDAVVDRDLLEGFSALAARLWLCRSPASGSSSSGCPGCHSVACRPRRATMFPRPGEVTPWLAACAIVDFVQASEQVRGQDCSGQRRPRIGRRRGSVASSSSGCAGAGPEALFAACFRITSPRASPLKNSADECGQASAGALRAEVSSSPRPSQPSSTP